MAATLFPPVSTALGAIAALTLSDAGFDACVEETPDGRVVSVRFQNAGHSDATARPLVAPEHSSITLTAGGFVLRSSPFSGPLTAGHLPAFVRHVLNAAVCPYEMATH